MLELLVEQVLVDLEADCSYDHGRGGGDGWNDLACDDFDFVSWGFLDLVVSCSQVGTSGHEVDVAVAVVVFFEFDWDNLYVWISWNRG